MKGSMWIIALVPFIILSFNNKADCAESGEARSKMMSWANKMKGENGGKMDMGSMIGKMEGLMGGKGGKGGGADMSKIMGVLKNIGALFKGADGKFDVTNVMNIAKGFMGGKS